MYKGQPAVCFFTEETNYKSSSSPFGIKLCDRVSGRPLHPVSYTHLLPEYSVVHKQDWFIRERYRPATGEGDMSFLSRSYERHFNERPFLKMCIRDRLAICPLQIPSARSRTEH